MNKEDEKFKTKLSLNSGLANEEVFEICFKLAWERGHSSGYSEVRQYFYDLEEEIEKVYNIGYSFGESEGYRQGYNDGYDSGSSDGEC